MNIRWLFGIYARPEDAPSRRLASEASTLAHQKYVSQGRFWRLTIVAIMLPAAVVFKWVMPWLMTMMGYAGNAMAQTVAIACWCLLFWLWSAWIYRYLYRRPVRAALRELGHNICPECGYSLDGLGEESVRCPECGSEVRTPAGLAEIPDSTA